MNDLDVLFNLDIWRLIQEPSGSLNCSYVFYLRGVVDFVFRGTLAGDGLGFRCLRSQAPRKAWVPESRLWSST